MNAIYKKSEKDKQNNKENTIKNQKTLTIKLRTTKKH